jgi:external thioesterase TEII
MKDKPQLFLLHFAGGSCYSFQYLYPLLSDFQLIPLELPGRGRRFNESLLRDFNNAAKDIYYQVRSKIASSNFIIYGHSMGAYLALKVCSLLELDHTPPRCIVVSGNPGPGIEFNKQRHLMERSEFIKELKELGGFPSELLGNKEVFDFFEPVLRADFELTEKDHTCANCTISVPIFAMMGDREERVAEICNWSKFTRAVFLFEILEGDHFFIHHHSRRIAQVIKNCLEVSFFSKESNCPPLQ